MSMDAERELTAAWDRVWVRGGVTPIKKYVNEIIHKLLKAFRTFQLCKARLYMLNVASILS